MLGTVERNPLYINAMRSLGANTSRVFFPFRRGGDGFTRAPTAEANLRRLLSQAEEQDLQLVVVGGFEGTDSPFFWSDPGLKRSFVQHWDWLASVVDNHPAVAGLDLMNEPNPPWPSGKIEEAQLAWHPLAREAIAAIRNRGVNRAIVFEPVAGGNAIGLAGMMPFADAGVVYSIHFYTPHDITHQKVSAAWPRTIPYPADMSYRLGAWDAKLGITPIDKARLILEVEPARAFQLRHDVAIYVGEFSCVRWAPAGSALRWIRDALEIFTRYGWSWTYHEFRGWPGWDAEIDSEDPEAARRSEDAPVMHALRAAMARRAA